MAIASCNVNIIGRSGGRCSVAAAAYRAGEKLHDERTGKTHDYSRKRNIAYTEILTPTPAPAWAKERSRLWNTVEKGEKRYDAQTAREIRIALPKELTLQQNIDALRDYAKTFVKQGMIADIALHNEKGNPHAHMMLTTRSIDENGFGQKVRDWNKPEKVVAWRKEYETVINHHLEKAGCSERIDIRSNADRGIEKIPTIHLGHSSHAKEQRGEHTIRGDRNRAIEEKNRQIEQANKDIALVKRAMRHELETMQLEQTRQREANRQRAAKMERGDTTIISEAEMHKHIQQEAERKRQQLEAQRQAAAEREQQRQQEAEHQRKRQQQEADRRAAQEQKIKRQQQQRETAPRTVSETDMQKQLERWIEQARKELQRQETQPQKPSIWEVIQKETAEREAVWKRQEQEQEAADRRRAAEQEKEQAQKMEVLKRKQEADRRAAQQQPPPSEYMKKWQRRVQEHRENQPTTEPEREPEHHDRPQSEFMQKWQEQVQEYRHHKPERHIERKYDHDRGR